MLEEVPMLEQVLVKERDWAPQWQFRCKHWATVLQATKEESKTGF